MKKILILVLFSLQLLAQEITNKLGGETSNETYDITDSNDTQLFRVEGDGTVLIGTNAQNGDLEIDGDEIIRGDLYLRDSFYDKDAEAGTSGQILSSTVTGTDWIDAPSGGLYNAYVKVSDTKSSSTNGGDFNSGDWRTRVINTEDSDPQDIASISSNQITLPAGTYYCNIICPAMAVNTHQARLRNITGGATLLVGTSSYCATTYGQSLTYSIIVGRFTIAVESVLEIQHRANSTYTGIGFGIASNFGESSVYTAAEFWKEN